MNIYAVPPLISAFLLLSFSLFVLFSNAKSKINLTGAFACFSTFVWLLGYSFMYASKDESSALFWARFGYNGVFFIPLFAYHFVINIFGFQRKRITIILLYSTSIPFLIVNRTDYFLKGMYTYFWGYYPKVGSAYIFFAIFFALIFIRCVMLSYYAMQGRKGSSPLGYNQAKYVLLAFAIASTSVVDYFQNYGIGIYPWGYLSATGWVILIVIAVTKYRLMDINVALTRASIFIVVYAIVLGIPFIFGYRYGQWQLATWLTVFLATLGPFLYNYLRRGAENVLLKEQRRYQKALIGLSKTMGRIRDIDQLLRTIVLTIVDKVKVPYAAIYLKDEQYKSYHRKHYFPKKEEFRFQECIPVDCSLVNQLNENKKPLLSDEVGPQEAVQLDSGLVIPCFIEDSLLGFLLLGPKPNHQIYTPDDALIFETLSYSTSLAIENSQFWKEIEDRQRKARLQEMDTYSYSLAHEIDNPMQVIRGQIDLIRKSLLQLAIPEEMRKELLESADFAREACVRTSTMVKAIRDFGQKTTGELRPLKIQDVVESFSMLYYPQFKTNAVSFEKTSSLNDPVFVLGEKPELMQVLVIIANNAVHALLGVPQGQERLIILKLELPSPDWVRIRFSDNGYGIKQEMLEPIFKPFVTTKASTEGTGMGLHNAKKIVEKHKGKIWAESEGEGKGATFVIELPVAKNIKPEDNTQQEDKGNRLF